MAGPGSNLPGSKFARSRPPGPRGLCSGGRVADRGAPDPPPDSESWVPSSQPPQQATHRPGGPHDPARVRIIFCSVFSGSRTGATRFTSCARVGLIQQDEKALAVVTRAPSEAWGDFSSFKQFPCRPEFPYPSGSPRSFCQCNRRRFSSSAPLFLCLCAADIREGRAGQKRHPPIQTTIAALLCGQVGTLLHEVVFRLLVDPVVGQPPFDGAEHANRQSPLVGGVWIRGVALPLCNHGELAPRTAVDARGDSNGHRGSAHGGAGGPRMHVPSRLGRP